MNFEYWNSKKLNFLFLNRRVYQISRSRINLSEPHSRKEEKAVNSTQQSLYLTVFLCSKRIKLPHFRYSKETSFESKIAKKLQRERERENSGFQMGMLLVNPTLSNSAFSWNRKWFGGWGSGGEKEEWATVVQKEIMTIFTFGLMFLFFLVLRNSALFFQNFPRSLGPNEGSTLIKYSYFIWKNISFG